MKKFLIPLLVIGGLALLAFNMYKNFQNQLVNLDENSNQAWAEVESQYQRRSDLIPNLVETVKGYADFESETLIKVIEARSKATSTNIDASNLTPESLKQFQDAQSGLSGALSRLMVVVEKYPELKADQRFAELQAQIEGTENRISVARDRFNGEATNYNKHVKSFPNNIFAGMIGFIPKPLFTADPGSEKAPKVQF